MTGIAVVHHLLRSFTGHAADPLVSHGATLVEVDRRRGDALPALEDLAGIVTLGGEQSARDAERDPLLGEEVAWLRDAVGREVPVLGVCLGAQLLARALGGSVFELPRCNLAWKKMELTAEASTDAIVGGLERPIGLFWNHDAIVPAPGSVELLRAPGEGCAAFRHGTWAWGVQFHPEVTDDALADWWARWGREQLAQSGVEEAPARAADARHIGRQAGFSEAVFGRFAAVVARAGDGKPAAAIAAPAAGR
jgi:GMP synthase (glutamine-hydrolysing)